MFSENNILILICIGAILFLFVVMVIATICKRYGVCMKTNQAQTSVKQKSVPTEFQHTKTTSSRAQLVELNKKRTTLTKGAVVIIDPIVYNLVSNAIINSEKNVEVGVLDEKLSRFWGKVMREKVLLWKNGTSTPYEDGESVLGSAPSTRSMQQASHVLAAVPRRSPNTKNQNVRFHSSVDNSTLDTSPLNTDLLDVNNNSTVSQSSIEPDTTKSSTKRNNTTTKEKRVAFVKEEDIHRDSLTQSERMGLSSDESSDAFEESDSEIAILIATTTKSKKKRIPQRSGSEQEFDPKSNEPSNVACDPFKTIEKPKVPRHSRRLPTIKRMFASTKSGSTKHQLLLDNESEYSKQTDNSSIRSSLSSQHSVEKYSDKHVDSLSLKGRNSSVVVDPLLRNDEDGNIVLQIEKDDRVRSIRLTRSLLSLNSDDDDEIEDTISSRNDDTDNQGELPKKQRFSRSTSKGSTKSTIPSENDTRKSSIDSESSRKSSIWAESPKHKTRKSSGIKGILKNDNGEEGGPDSRRTRNAKSIRFTESEGAVPVKNSPTRKISGVLNLPKVRKPSLSNKRMSMRSPDNSKPPDFPTIPSEFELDIAEHHKSLGKKSNESNRGSVDVGAFDYYFQGSGNYRRSLRLGEKDGRIKSIGKPRSKSTTYTVETDDLIEEDKP